MTTATVAAPRRTAWRSHAARWWPVGAGVALGAGLAWLGAVAPEVAGALFLTALLVAWRWGR